MTRPRNRPRNPEPRRPAHRRRTGLWVGLGLGAALFVAVVVAESSDTPTVPTAATSGTVEAAGLTVVGSSIALGQVPLNTTVVPTWTLENTGPVPVSLGQPHATVEEGCCPGPLTYDTDRLDPGDSATLTFPLQMHPGMDGPHRFTIHVPIANTDEILALEVTGDFRN